MNHDEKITIDQINGENHLLFDARSPKEYREYHLPGASNLSLFSDDERVEIGTLYKQEGRECAMERGLEIVSPKLPDFYRTLKKAVATNPNKQVVIYCARGGMRSKTLVETMNLMGIHCLQLEGGIRSYRRKIEELFIRYTSNPKNIIVIEGYTGTMKTKILERLQNDGYPVINLEKMAEHKGSVFGSVGENPVSQKMFESRLYERLNELNKEDTLIIEAESKRIGRVTVPDFLLEGKEKGTRIHIHMPFYQRVKFICEVYEPSLHKLEIEQAINKLQKRMNPLIMNEITERLSVQDYESIVSLLLENYYDPKYEYSEQKYKSRSIDVDGESFDEIYSKVKEELNNLINTH